MEQNYMNAGAISILMAMRNRSKEDMRTRELLPCYPENPVQNPCSWNVIPMCRQSSCRKHGGCFYPSLRLDLLPMFKYMGLEGGCVTLSIWRVQYWREMLLLLASAAGGRARGGCSDVSCRAQLRKIQLRCGIFRCDLSGCSSRFV